MFYQINKNRQSKCRSTIIWRFNVTLVLIFLCSICPLNIMAMFGLFFNIHYKYASLRWEREVYLQWYSYKQEFTEYMSLICLWTFWFQIFCLLTNYYSGVIEGRVQLSPSTSQCVCAKVILYFSLLLYWFKGNRSLVS